MPSGIGMCGAPHSSARSASCPSGRLTATIRAPLVCASSAAWSVSSVLPEKDSANTRVVGSMKLGAS